MLARAARAAGATAMELGFPFSDPIADGPALQAASARALRHGTRWRHLLHAIRDASSELPCAVMTYANPVFRHGVTTAVGQIRNAGASGLIVPDLAWEESGLWRRACASGGIALVQMAAPGTRPNRVAALTRATRGFLYLVSHYGTTGGPGFSDPGGLSRIVAVAHQTSPRTSVLVGFGIRRPEDVRDVRSFGADGVVVGSAFEEALGMKPTAFMVRRFLVPFARALN